MNAVQLPRHPPQILGAVVLRVVIHVIDDSKRRRARVKHPCERDHTVDVVLRTTALQVLELLVTVVLFEKVFMVPVEEPLATLADEQGRILGAIPHDNSERRVNEDAPRGVYEFAGHDRYL